MSRRRVLAFCLTLGATAVLALPALAGARIAYVTGSGYTSHVAPVDLAAGVFGAEIPISGEGSPLDVAIIPNGKTAYVTGNGDVVPIDVATNAAGPSIDTGIQSCPRAIATKPDGTRVYVTDSCEGSVSVIDVATGTELTDVPVGSPDGIAVTADGSRALVTSFSEESVIPIDLATNTAGTPIPLGDYGRGIAVTPNGAAAYVVVRNDDEVRRIDLATNTVGPAIPVAEFPEELAISPDSSRAYVVGNNQPVTPIDLLTDTPGTAIPMGGNFLEDVAVMPDGSRAWVTDEEPGNRLVPIDIPGNTLGTPIPALGRPAAIAIVPNQGPVAAFTGTPNPVLRGETVNFNAGTSADSDGSVTRYDWDFGDGTILENGGPTPHHTYSFGGTYTVTLTVTDNEGCSLEIVFPGQTAHCNGGPPARTSHQLQVNPKCITVNGSASTFVPKYRPARVAPGLRVRLAASSPAKLSVDPTMTWTKGGGGKASLPNLTTTVQQWRRVRFLIPGNLRDRLPLGTSVKLHLRIEATPLDETLCGGQATERTLRLKVVKVIPGVVQAGRVP